MSLSTNAWIITHRDPALIRLLFSTTQVHSHGMKENTAFDGELYLVPKFKIIFQIQYWNQKLHSPNLWITEECFIVGKYYQAQTSTSPWSRVELSVTLKSFDHPPAAHPKKSTHKSRGNANQNLSYLKFWLIFNSSYL